MTPPTVTRCPTCGAAMAGTHRRLTVRQAQLYRFIVDTLTDRGVAPSFNEIAAHFGYVSLATVHEHLTNLERKDFIRRGYGEARAITALVPLDHMGGVPV